MKEKVSKFVNITKTLLDYIDEEQVYDKLADAGCGGIDPYRSEQFDRLIKDVRNAASQLEVEILKLDV